MHYMQLMVMNMLQVLEDKFQEITFFNVQAKGLVGVLPLYAMIFLQSYRFFGHNTWETDIV